MKHIFRNYGIKVDENLALIGISISTLLLSVFTALLANLLSSSKFELPADWIKLVSYLLVSIAAIILFTISNIKQNKFKTDYNKLEGIISSLKKNKLKAEKDLGSEQSKFIETSKLIIDLYLKNFANEKLDFSSSNSKGDRISIYLHDDNFGQKSLDVLYQVGRYSINDQFNESGRGVYPIGEGCIGQAWNRGIGWVFESELSDPINDWDKYSSEQIKFDIDTSTLNSLRMKSRFYCSWRLNVNNHSKLAVIVLESLEPNRWTEDEIKEAFNKHEELFLVQILDEIKDYLVGPSLAFEEGF